MLINNFSDPKLYRLFLNLKTSFLNVKHKKIVHKIIINYFSPYIKLDISDLE